MKTSTALARVTGTPLHEILDGEIVDDRQIIQGATNRQRAGVDMLAMLLQDKRAAGTRRAYTGDLKDFFACTATNELILDFLSWPPDDIRQRVQGYKGEMLSRKLAEATVNRRLTTIRKLVKMGFRHGLCLCDGRDMVDGEKVTPYRDTRGVDLETLKELIVLPFRVHPGTRRKHSLRALRDSAILRLFCEWALRRAEVGNLNVDDFDARMRRLTILGKGRGTQKEGITLSRDCVRDIENYVDAAGHDDGAMFRNLDHRPHMMGTRLTNDGLYFLVKQYGAELGYPKLTPHKLRHSAITAALDATGGDIRRVKRFSRHKDYKTLEYYDDNRTDFGGEVSNLLSGLLR